MLLAKMHRTMRDDEAGQALILGVLTMLVLALGVMVTLQLGHTVNERIRVQNAADNAAFSVGAAVARSLNFIAWTNRAMVVHYVAAMALQSVVSMVTALRAMTGMLSDTFQTMAALACAIRMGCQLCVGIPIVGVACGVCVGVMAGLQAAFQGLATALKAASEGINSVLDTVDAPIAFLVARIGDLNRYVMVNAQRAMKNMTIAALGSIATATNFEKRIIRETAGEANEANTTGLVYDLAMAGLNAADSYRNMFDDIGGDSIPTNGGTYATSHHEDDHDAKQKAERLMAEIANASRTGTAGQLTWETNHRLLGAGALAQVMGWADISHMGATRLVNPMTPGTFTEEGGGGGGAPSGNVAQCQNAQNTCNNASANCTQKGQQYDQKQAECDQANAACGPCGGTGQPPCSLCPTAPSKCQAAQIARAVRDAACDQAKSACQDGVNAACGGGPGNNTLTDPGQGNRNFVFDKEWYQTQFTRGPALDSAEWVEASVFGAGSLAGNSGSKIVGIQSAHDSQDRYHCKYDGRTDIPNIPGCPNGAWTKPVKCTRESEHAWEGISPYLSFRSQNTPENLFNQPDYWAFVNKAPERARLQADLAFGFDRTGTFTWDNAGPRAQLTGMNAPGLDASLGGFGKGLNAWARAQVYYHRPGYWMEPPNLFNPFWRSKLAPIGPRKGTLAGAMPLPSELGHLVDTGLVH